MSDDLAALVGGLRWDCRSTVVRRGVEAPCPRPASCIIEVAGRHHPACAYHGHRAGDGVIPLAEIIEALVARLAPSDVLLQVAREDLAETQRRLAELDAQVAREKVEAEQRAADEKRRVVEDRRATIRRKPRTRRQYQSGSIYQRSSDGRWMGEIQAGWKPGGGRRVVYVSSGLPGSAGEAEVKRKLDKRRREIEASGIPDHTGRATVKAFAGPWLERQSTRLRPSAYSTTRSAVQTWIIPTIGQRQLGNLSPADIRAIHKAMLTAGRKPSSATRAHSTIISMLRDAILEGHPVPQRVLLTEGPGTNTSDRKALSDADAAAMLAFAAAELPHASRWIAALLQGLRQGEALGLTWAAYDRLPDAIDISWQLQPLPYNVVRDRSSGFRVPVGFEARQLADRWHLTRPKTEAGTRLIPKLPFFAEVMETWRRAAPSSPHDLVWPAADGTPAHPEDDLAEWKGLQGAVGVGHPAGRYYVVHEARHTTASLLLKAGVDRKTIEDILGQVKLVEAYLHTDRSQSAAALARVAAALRLAGGTHVAELEATK